MVLEMKMEKQVDFYLLIFGFNFKYELTNDTQINLDADATTSLILKSSIL